MNAQPKFLIKQFLAWLFVFGFLFPEAVRFYHQFKHTQKEICKTPGSLHFHQSVTDCSLLDFHFTTALNLQLSESTFSEYTLFYNHLFSLKALYSQEVSTHFFVRGPPVLS